MVEPSGRKLNGERMTEKRTAAATELHLVGEGKPTATTDVVFIHGIGGDSFTTWTGGATDNDRFWPLWLDAAIPEAQIWTAHYPAQLSRWFGPSFPLIQGSIALLDRLTQRIGSRPIVFVCHSLGGLIAKQALRVSSDSPAREDFRRLGENVVGIVFLGTPHQGAFLASVARRLASALGPVARLSGFTESTTELAKENAHLENLGDWFRSIVARRRLQVLVYTENLPTKGTVIVDNHSANPGLVDVQSIPMALNHFQLAGPRLRGDQISEGIIKFVRGVASQRASPTKLVRSTALEMEIGVLQADASQWKHGADNVLQYSLRRSESEIKISYELGYLNTFRAGGLIYPMNYLLPPRCPFLWDYPTLDLKFVNNADRTVFLSEIVIDVDESKPIREPLFAIRRDVQGRHAGILILINEGWVELRDLELHFNITPGLITDAIPVLRPYKHSIDAGHLVDRLEIDVTPAFANDGIDISDLLLLTNGEWADDGQLELPEVEGSRERLSRDELRRRQEKALGPFKEWVGTLAGEACYAPVAAPDERRSVKFQTFVYLANRNLLGIPRPITFQYQIALEADGRSYNKVLPISQELKAGDTDRFTLKIAIPQSSSHCLRLKVRDVSGHELQSMPIALECFVPRSVRTSLHPTHATSTEPRAGPASEVRS